MFFKLSEKAQASLDQVVERFKAGDLGPVVNVFMQRLELPENAPARKWSFANQVLAYAQSGCLDCRGYNQWQEVKRTVKKGTHGVFILGPCMKKVDDEKRPDEKKQILIGFTGISVHPLVNTDGDPIADYMPAEPPPLLDVAKRMGVTVTWQPVAPDRNGDYQQTTDHINVGTTDAKTFFHELAHAAHKRVAGTLKGGQDTQQEAVAEVTATVLMHMYGLGDRVANCWQYVAMYAPKDPLHAIQNALGDVEKVLSVLLGSEEGELNASTEETD